MKWSIFVFYIIESLELLFSPKNCVTFTAQKAMVYDCVIPCQLDLLFSKTAFNLGPLSVRQRADSGPILRASCVVATECCHLSSFFLYLPLTREYIQLALHHLLFPVWTLNRTWLACNFKFLIFRCLASIYNGNTPGNANRTEHSVSVQPPFNPYLASVHKRKLTWAFVARQCCKYQGLVCLRAFKAISNLNFVHVNKMPYNDIVATGILYDPWVCIIIT